VHDEVLDALIAIDLTGRLAVVTGGSGELGRVMSRTLGRCGADVALTYHQHADRAQAVATEIEGIGRAARAFHVDVTDSGSVLALREAVRAWRGDPDVVVCNAVVQYEWQRVLDQPLEDYESQFRSCVLHAVLMAKVFAPAMIARGWGRLVAISTECAVQALPGQSAYVAGKRGMDGVLRVLAKEVGEH
jgi:3-oxoacyl-[acyl-carrier protein] reductase